MNIWLRPHWRKDQLYFLWHSCTRVTPTFSRQTMFFSHNLQHAALVFKTAMISALNVIQANDNKPQSVHLKKHYPNCTFNGAYTHTYTYSISYLKIIFKLFCCHFKNSQLPFLFFLFCFLRGWTGFIWKNKETNFLSKQNILNQI